MTTRKRQKTAPRAARRVLLIAAIAALIIALAVAAYATDIFGIRALLVPGTDRVSLTKAQDVPESLDPGIAERLENSRLAWAEWEAWRGEYIASLAPEGIKPGDTLAVFDNEDGSRSVEIRRTDEATGQESVEMRELSPEEYESLGEWLDFLRTQYGYNEGYGVHDAAMAAKLEEIAEKYGLRFLGDVSVAWSSDTAGMTGEGFYTNEELAEKTAEFAGSGNIFAETPAGFDKVYWYEEGNFCVSWYYALPDGEWISCYGYNSMYDVLTSGSEVGNAEVDPAGFSTRTYTAADGTELTILSNGESAYIYAYLENSFFVENVNSTLKNVELTDETLDAIADMLIYSRIGK